MPGGRIVTTIDNPSPAVGIGPGTDGMYHYLIPMIGVETVELRLWCRSRPNAWCCQDGSCRYVEAVTWSEHRQVMTEVDYAGEATVAHAGHIDFVIVGENDAGARRYAWFYRSDVSSPRRWWQPQHARQPWQDAGHFLRGDVMLYGAGDSGAPIRATDDDEAAHTTLPGQAALYRHETGCAECRCDVLSQRADWQRNHLGIVQYWGRCAVMTGVRERT
jgi:hypothetical protein